MFSNRLDENRATLTAIRDKPTPEVGTLERSRGCSPSTADKREVQRNDRVRRSKPNLDNVVGTQVTIFRDKLLLHDHPLIARCCGKAWPPETLLSSIIGSWVISPKHLASVDLLRLRDLG
jgi:hypothetical protein